MDDFARVLAEAGEPEPAERPAGVRALAEVQARVEELNAARMARWLQLEASRRAGWEAYQLGRARMGIKAAPAEACPWLTAPPRIRIW